ncbi:MAG: hypothetical protein LBF38_09150, partial [Deltaproteobacteria bacterium]|nr:hypothetical protein [Deltaproteobacteria bacterium]
GENDSPEAVKGKGGRTRENAKPGQGENDSPEAVKAKRGRPRKVAQTDRIEKASAEGAGDEEVKTAKADKATERKPRITAQAKDASAKPKSREGLTVTLPSPEVIRARKWAENSNTLNNFGFGVDNRRPQCEPGGVKSLGGGESRGEDGCGLGQETREKTELKLTVTKVGNKNFYNVEAIVTTTVTRNSLDGFREVKGQGNAVSPGGQNQATSGWFNGFDYKNPDLAPLDVFGPVEKPKDDQEELKRLLKKSGAMVFTKRDLFDGALREHDIDLSKYNLLLVLQPKQDPKNIVANGYSNKNTFDFAPFLTRVKNSLDNAPDEIRGRGKNKRNMKNVELLSFGQVIRKLLTLFRLNAARHYGRDLLEENPIRDPDNLDQLLDPETWAELAKILGRGQKTKNLGKNYGWEQIDKAINDFLWKHSKNGLVSFEEIMGKENFEPMKPILGPDKNAKPKNAQGNKPGKSAKRKAKASPEAKKAPLIGRPRGGRGQKPAKSSPDQAKALPEAIKAPLIGRPEENQEKDGSKRAGGNPKGTKSRRASKVERHD